MHLVPYNSFQKGSRSNILRMYLEPFPKPLKIYQRNLNNLIFPFLHYMISRIYLSKKKKKQTNLDMWDGNEFQSLS